MADAPGKLPGKYNILFTKGAEQDIEAIYDYIVVNEGIAAAQHVLDRLVDVIESLSRLAERGSYPKELSTLGIHEYRQMLSKPYRIIYRVSAHKVIIYVIADGRRDMQSLLARRLLGA